MRECNLIQRAAQVQAQLQNAYETVIQLDEEELLLRSTLELPVAKKKVLRNLEASL